MHAEQPAKQELQRLFCIKYPFVQPPQIVVFEHELHPLGHAEQFGELLTK